MAENKIGICAESGPIVRRIRAESVGPVLRPGGAGGPVAVDRSDCRG
jgi:hypothetical protein